MLIILCQFEHKVQIANLYRRSRDSARSNELRICLILLTEWTHLVDHVEDFGENEAALLGVYGCLVERARLLEHGGFLQVAERIRAAT